MSSHFNRIQGILANLFLVFFAIVLVFVVSEIAARWFFGVRALDGSYQTTDELHYPRPYVEAVASRQLEDINGLGYKGALPVMPKPEAEFRIAMVGGSTVFGYHPKKDRNYGIQPLPGYLGEELQRRHGKHVKVYNFGITSTVAQQELARVVMDVVSYEPDLIVSYGGGNDFFNFESVGYPHRFLWSEMNPLWITDLEKYPTLPLLALGSALLRNLFGTYLEQYFSSRVRNMRYSDDQHPFYSNAVNNYSESIRRMEVVSNAFGAQFIGYFHPIRLFYFGDKKERERAEDFLQNVENTVNKMGVKNYRSLKGVFEGSPESIWLDDIHIYDDANKKMAAHLANDLTSFIGSDPTKVE